MYISYITLFFYSSLNSGRNDETPIIVVMRAVSSRSYCVTITLCYYSCTQRQKKDTDRFY